MFEKTFARGLALMVAAAAVLIPAGAQSAASQDAAKRTSADQTTVKQTTARQGGAKLTIHADRPVSKVSPTLYGLMTEEINYSYDGGLYAEMVRNRTFGGDWSGVVHWILLENGSAQAKIGADKGTGPSEALKQSLRIDVAKADAENQAGVLNVGYWGMAVRPATTYKGSFWAKADGAEMGPVTVALVSNQTGKAEASSA